MQTFFHQLYETLNNGNLHAKSASLGLASMIFTLQTWMLIWYLWIVSTP